MRVFIADGNSSVRLALQMYLQQEPGLYVTGMAAEANGLPTQVEASKPDVLLLDSHLPGPSMEGMISEIRGLDSPPFILVMSIKSESREPALAAGADGFISKNALPDDLIEQFRILRQSPGPATE